MSERTSGHWLILDRHCAIVAAQTIDGAIEQNLGRVLWDIYPEAEHLYAQTFTDAWDDGRAEILAFHVGRLIHVTARRTVAGLRVGYKVLAQLDTVTLPALRSSLDRLILIADAQVPPPSPSSPAVLRLIDAP
jgi:hypothetical protein